MSMYHQRQKNCKAKNIRTGQLLINCWIQLPHSTGEFTEVETQDPDGDKIWLKEDICPGIMPGQSAGLEFERVGIESQNCHPGHT